MVSIGALFAPAPAFAADITVVTSGAFTAAYRELAPQYERATHNKLVSEFGPSMGTTHDAIPMRLQRGEKIDVVIMAVDALDDLIRQGKVRSGSRVDLVRSRHHGRQRTGAQLGDGGGAHHGERARQPFAAVGASGQPGCPGTLSTVPSGPTSTP